jgi:hypothetical protein
MSWNGWRRSRRWLVLSWLDEQYPSIGLIRVDGGYANVVDGSLIDWADHELGVRLEVVKRNDDPRGFQVLPRRWVVERSFGWLTRCRRLCRDYERTIDRPRRGLHQDRMIRLMAARLTEQSTRYNNIREAST